jgi:hypothetical protein
MDVDAVKAACAGLLHELLPKASIKTSPVPILPSLEPEIHRRCLPAVFFDLILDLLPLVERTQSGALDSGDMNKHVLFATPCG